MGQFERSLNRLYGIEQDRPAVVKYVRAFLLVLTSGSFLAAAFLVLALGRGVLTSTAETVLRWPLAVLLAAVGLGALFDYAPKRRQPAWSWLAFGAIVAVALWTVSTLLLAGAFRLASSWGDTYGPLAGIVALQLWTFASACAILYGGAVMAQLEAVRAGVREPEEDEQRQPSPRELVGRLAPNR
jgi:YihY family inner membrane protein